MDFLEVPQFERYFEYVVRNKEGRFYRAKANLTFYPMMFYT